MARKTKQPTDSVVIYWSAEDKCYTAHSLRTDQIGLGPRIVDALAEVMRAVAYAKEVADGDSRVSLLHEAPKDIQQLAKKAKPLPLEIYDIAHKMVTGEWPDYISTPDVKSAQPLRADLQATC